MKNMNTETNMASQNTTSQAAKLRLTAVFRLVPLLLSGGPLSETAAHVSRIVCALTCELLKFAPSIVWAGCHMLGSYLLAPAPFPVRPNLAVILATAAVHSPG